MGRIDIRGSNHDFPSAKIRSIRAISHAGSGLNLGLQNVWLRRIEEALVQKRRWHLTQLVLIVSNAAGCESFRLGARMMQAYESVAGQNS